MDHNDHLEKQLGELWTWLEFEPHKMQQDYGQLPVTGIAAPMDPEMGMMLKPDVQADQPVEQMELEGGAQKRGFSNTLDESVSETLVRPNQSDAIN